MGRCSTFDRDFSYVSPYDMVFDCFDHSTGRPVVISKLRKKACLSAKVLLHFAIQRKRVGDEADEVAHTAFHP